MHEIDQHSEDNRLAARPRGTGVPGSHRWNSAIHYVLTIAASGAVAMFLFDGFGTAVDRIAGTPSGPAMAPEIDPRSLMGAVATFEGASTMAVLAEAEPATGSIVETH